MNHINIENYTPISYTVEYNEEGYYPNDTLNEDGEPITWAGLENPYSQATIDEPVIEEATSVTPDKTLTLIVIDDEKGIYELLITPSQSNNFPSIVNGTSLNKGISSVWERLLSQDLWKDSRTKFVTPLCVDYMDPTVGNDNVYQLILDQSAINAGFIKDSDGAGYFVSRLDGKLPSSCYDLKYRFFTPLIRNE